MIITTTTTTTMMMKATRLWRSIFWCLVVTTFVSGRKHFEPERNVSMDSSSSDRPDINRKLTVTTVLQPPYMLLRQHGHFLAGNDRFEGFLADILQRLATSVGFDYEIRMSRDFGRLPDGMIQEIQKGQADIAAGTIIMPSSTSHPTVDYTESFLSFRVSALFRRTHGSRSPTDRISTSAYQILGSNFTYGVIQNGPIQQLITNSTDPVVRALWTRMNNFWPPGLVSSVQEGVERTRREKYAFLVETPTAEYVSSRRPCELHASEPFLDVMNYAFVMRKDDFRLRNLISRELRRMKQTDELQTIYLKWWRDECAGHFSSARRSPDAATRRRLANANVFTSAGNNYLFDYSVVTMWLTLAILFCRLR